MGEDTTFEGFSVVESAPQQGFFIDFMGVRTRLSYFPEWVHHISGMVFGLPAPGAALFFEYEEWQGFTAAVREAKETFSFMELGCGWGPWLVSALTAAGTWGLEAMEFVGVEAEPTEIEKLHSHFQDNGFDANDYMIINAAIDEHDAPAASGNPGGAPLLSLETLLSGRGRFDLIHCDIQYAESRAFRAGIEAVTRQVKRIVVGTHSRKIEDELIGTFVDAGWRLENECACKYRIIDGRPSLITDGAQVWRNGRL